MALNEFMETSRMVGSTVLDFAEDPRETTDRVKKAAKAKVRRKKSKYQKALSSELKKANKAARTKAGRLRKGMTPGKILKKAHKAARRRVKPTRRR